MKRERGLGKIKPLPSLIKAAAMDAANGSMRKAGRSAWSEADFNVACETEERLIRACYGRKADGGDDRCYLRFAIAECMEADGRLTLRSNMKGVLGKIDAVLHAGVA